MLSGNLSYCAWLKLDECGENGRHSRNNIFHAIASCQHNEHGNGKCGDILLIFEPFVRGEQDIKVGGGKRQ